MDRDAALQLLRTAVGSQEIEFREGQWEAIDALVNKSQKLLVVQRTGWGKSSVYFVATRILRDRGAGPTIIISPLLALMRNQIEAAERLGISAVTINSSNPDDWEVIREQLIANHVDAMLISPERLANETFMAEFLQPVAGSIGLMVVDEAHCISDWGHDFRPDYRRLVSILQQMPPNAPILGTTATANDRVVEDVLTQLGDIAVLRGTLVRESLVLQTIRLPDQASRLAWLSENIPHMQGTGIIYVLTKRDAKLVARWLQENGINAQAYFSGIEADGFDDSNSYRIHLETQLLHNELEVLVATTALGMGYDKPDLGFVIHYQAPGSIVGYYQQVGRAGRAIERAYGILLSGREDAEIHQFFRRSAFPKESDVEQILEALERHDGLSVRMLERELNLRHGQIQQALKFLSVESPSPVIKEGSKWNRTPVAYSLPRERIDRLTNLREREWEEVQGYIDSKSCLMNYLQEALDDQVSGPCMNCEICICEEPIPSAVTDDMVFQAHEFLHHTEMPLKTKVQVPAGAMPTYGFSGNLPQVLRAEEGRVLSRWGDAVYGRWVADDKHNNHFRDELVQAVAEMIDMRWQPQPAPTWVTCVPSLRHHELVPDYAARLAQALGLPFIPCITKTAQNEAQKAQQNKFHQYHNLDGAFAITDDVEEGSVLLVDDIFDSGCTMTIIAALLRQADSGPVFPVALADAGTSG